jgi:hypothetical protein
MNDQTYNGWTNYATWRVNLELLDGLDPRDYFPDCEDVLELMDAIKQYCEEYIFESAQDFARHYALAFLNEVDWHEIAKHMAEDCKLFQTETEVV